jgi:hypothetical protein
MQVGAADAAGLDAHLDVAGPEWRHRDILDPQIFSRV